MDAKKIKNSKAAQYEKPTLRIIELAAEQVLAGKCKTSQGASNLRGNCAFNTCFART